MANRPSTPQSIFDKVAPYYDFINSFLSFGQDRRWRNRLASALELPPEAAVLDVATGTAAVAIAIAKNAPSARIVGCDINGSMLAIAAERVSKARPQANIELTKSAGESLPFDDREFDAVTIAFAIDDMEDRAKCAGEMFRVLKPGGQIALLELSLPERGPIRFFYEMYLGIFPLIGFLFRRANYSHLREEILTYRGRKAIEKLLQETGFVEYRWQALTGGIVTLHLAHKPRIG